MLSFEHGYMVDLFRYFEPEKRGVFTCWNTYIDARYFGSLYSSIVIFKMCLVRKSNFGTRIDYILCTPNLLPWFKSCSVESDIMGSDHCPVSAIFHDNHPVTGESLLSALLNEPSTDYRDPPQLCAKFWDKFSKKQLKLKDWTTKPASLKRDLSLNYSNADFNTINDLNTSIQNPKKQKTLNVYSSQKSQPKRHQQASILNYIRQQPSATILSDNASFISDSESSNNVPNLCNSKPEETCQSLDIAKKFWSEKFTPMPVPLCHHEEPCKLLQSVLRIVFFYYIDSL